MAIVVTNADATTLSPAAPPGNRRKVIVRIKLDSSYPTGGSVLAPSAFGFNTIVGIISNGVSESGRMCAPILSSGTWKLKVYAEGASVFAEVANATDLSADFVTAVIYGY